MPRRPPAFLGPILLAATSVLVCLLLAEGAVRLAAPQQTLLLREDIFHAVDTLGWAHRPDIATEVNTGEGAVRIYTDHRGYRVGAEGAVEGDKTVLLLGDSFMAALQVEYEESLAGLMEVGLSEALGQTVAVRNAGVGAWDPPHYLIEIRRALAREPAELVVVAVYLGNDIVERGADYFPPREETPRPPFRIPFSISPAAWFDGLVRPVDFHLRSSSHLYVLARTQLVELRMRLGLSSVYFPEEYLASEADADRWDVTAEILDEVAMEAEARGVPVVFVLIPAHFQVVQEDLDRHVRAFGIDAEQIRIDQPNELLGERIRAAGWTVLDPLPALRQAHEEGVRTYGRVDTHFSAGGHRVTWDFIRDTLVERLAGGTPEG